MPENAHWKHETCETCEFQVDGRCRFGPVSRNVRIQHHMSRLELQEGARPLSGIERKLWSEACAQWQRRVVRCQSLP